jgi:hypothetical protein
VDAGHRIVLVVRTRQQRRQLELLDVVLQALQGLSKLLLGLGLPLVQELVEDLGFLEAYGEALVPLDLCPQAREAPVQLLAPGGVVPDIGLRELGLDLGSLLALPIEVKGTPSRCPAVPRAFRWPRCNRS